MIFGNLTVNAQEMTSKEKTNALLSQGSQKIIELYNEQPFEMGPEWFDENGNLYPVTINDVKYIETITNIDKNSPDYLTQSDKELTSDEYKSWAPKSSKSACSSLYGAASCWETSAKRIMIIVQEYPKNEIMVINQWKTMPSVKSYDTIGAVYEDFNLSSAEGRQWYNTASNTEEQFVDYGWNCNNMKVSTSGQKGVSISQNIVDSAYSMLQNDLYLYGTYGSYFRMAASYQHAVTDIDLDTSKNFVFDAWGMGKVFNWNTSWNKWDNMQGACFNWSNYLWTC